MSVRCRAPTLVPVLAQGAVAPDDCARDPLGEGGSPFEPGRVRGTPRRWRASPSPLPSGQWHERMVDLDDRATDVNSRTSQVRGLVMHTLLLLIRDRSPYAG